MTIDLIIADDHPLLRKGLRQLIEDSGTIRIVAEAENGEEAIRYIREKRPQIAILDVQMPLKSGFDVVATLRKENCSTEFIFLTMYQEEDMFNRAMDAGVKGFVLKENSVHDIIECIRAVNNGKYYISPIISDYLLKRGTAKTTLIKNNPSLELLTPMELSIMKLISEQKTSKEIARILNISHRTVENHRLNIANKLNLHGSNSLLKFAIEHKSELL